MVVRLHAHAVRRISERGATRAESKRVGGSRVTIGGAGTIRLMNFGRDARSTARKRAGLNAGKGVAGVVAGGRSKRLYSLVGRRAEGHLRTRAILIASSGLLIEGLSGV